MRITRSAAQQPFDLAIKHFSDARAARFDVIIAESLDRFSHDQEHIAAFSNKSRLQAFPS
jgi:hypothetical protein